VPSNQSEQDVEPLLGAQRSVESGVGSISFYVALKDSDDSLHFVEGYHDP
jgi:hypothetical protein